MMQLIKTTDVYRVEDEAAAIKMIDDAREEALAKGYTLTKSSYVLKTKKSKGEIIDAWAVVSLEKTFND